MGDELALDSLHRHRTRALDDELAFASSVAAVAWALQLSVAVLKAQSVSSPQQAPDEAESARGAEAAGIVACRMVTEPRGAAHLDAAAAVEEPLDGPAAAALQAEVEACEAEAEEAEYAMEVDAVRSQQAAAWNRTAAWHRAARAG